MDTKVCSKCKSVKLFSEFHKKKSSKDGYRNHCKSCVKDQSSKYRVANSEKIREYAANYRQVNVKKEKERHSRYRAANPEKTRKAVSKCRAANLDKYKEYQVTYYVANSEKIKERHAKYRSANSEKIKEWIAKWCAANPHKGRAKESNRRAAKLEAIPSWLTEEDYKLMESIGEEADRLTKETGIKHEVDHIHPLQGKLICGLQCPTNLQILTKSQNCSKGNRFKPYVESA